MAPTRMDPMATGRMVVVRNLLSETYLRGGTRGLKRRRRYLIKGTLALLRTFKALALELTFVYSGLSCLVLELRIYTLFFSTLFSILMWLYLCHRSNTSILVSLSLPCKSEELFAGFHGSNLN